MSRLANVTLLLVEDEIDNRDMLADGLAAHGADVRTASSGEEALDLLRTWRPDVLISDLDLPGIDGYTLLETIRRDAPLAPLPAIALTGHAGTTDRERSLRTGYQKHLVKPARIRDIVSAVETLRGGGSKDLRAMLAGLNAVSPCRFTSLLRFAQDNTLVSLWTFDRERPEVDPFPAGLPIHASYCVLIRDTRKPCTIEDAAAHPQASPHPQASELACYVGVPLFQRDGRLFGTVCCYDEEAHTLAPSLVERLQAEARRLEPTLWQLFDVPS
ncbi:MAG: response regulator [Myxococcota bacterium]|nr:response regulator [Myxococcota bacterium]